jgi:hypothetical protein
MSVFRLSFEEAQANFASKNRYVRWHSQTESHPDHARLRLKEKIFRPGVNVSRKLSRKDTIFTIGSCFARSVEAALAKQGFPVLSRADAKSIFGAETGGTGWANRYNTSSILRELEWASGDKTYPKAAIFQTRLWRYVDLHSHPIVGAEPFKVVEKRRANLTQYFASAFSASVVTVTLGLTECWFDRTLNDYINFVPNLAAVGKKKKPLLSDPNRFEFRVLDFQENMDNLEALFALLKRHNPRCHIVVTVSPVALTATFTERDVVVANCMSKSTLRACAETWQSLHPGAIDYFPSYEMAIMSDRAVVLMDDSVHIQQSFVDEIMAHFAANFIDGDAIAKPAPQPAIGAAV